MKIGTLINNDTINDMTDSLVLVTPHGIQVLQASGGTSSSDELCFDHLPQKLRSQRAQELWRELYKAGFVDNNCITTRSRTESAIMAKEMAARLSLSHYWNEFSELWQMANLKSAYGKSHDTQSGWEFEKKLNHLLT